MSDSSTSTRHAQRAHVGEGDDRRRHRQHRQALARPQVTAQHEAVDRRAHQRLLEQDRRLVDLRLGEADRRAGADALVDARGGVDHAGVLALLDVARRGDPLVAHRALQLLARDHALGEQRLPAPAFRRGLLRDFLGLRGRRPRLLALLDPRAVDQPLLVGLRDSPGRRVPRPGGRDTRPVPPPPAPAPS